MMLVLSNLYSILPAFASVTAFATSGVTVPAFGEGIKPRGPSTLPRRPTKPIMLGAAMQTSKSIIPPCTCATRSSAPTISAPAAAAASASAPFANTATRTFLPVPFGSTTAPRTCWSAWRESTPKRTWISTVSSNFAVAVFTVRASASSVSYSLVLSTSFALSAYFLPCFITTNFLL